MKIWISRDKSNMKHDVSFWKKEPLSVDGIFRGIERFVQDRYDDNFPFLLEKGHCKCVEIEEMEDVDTNSHSPTIL
ncbi:MAG: hypothetical protein IMZ53_10105 [Thermoplasmata archaeon]|nr:hypothetical protein [Thermoplasmata archaeon]